MSIRVRNGTYQVRVTPFPDQTLPTREAAEVVELDLKLRKKMGALYREPVLSFGAEIDGFLERKAARRSLRPASVSYYEQSAAPWKPLRATPICNLRRATVEDHITRRAKKAPVAARNELQLAKAVLREAASRGQTVDPGIFAIPTIRHEAAEGQVLDLDHLRALQAWLPDRLGRVVPFVGSVGLRFSEAFNLTDRMVDLTAAELRIPRDLNKSRRPKPIPLARYEVQLLREQMMERPAGTELLFPNAQGGVYSKSGFAFHWHPALKHEGLKGFKFHWLRHTAISLMAVAGMPVETIALRVGHSDGGALILKRYRHLYGNEARAAVGLLDAYMDGQEMALRTEEAVKHAGLQGETVGR
jgi:integrase